MEDWNTDLSDNSCSHLHSGTIYCTYPPCNAPANSQFSCQRCEIGQYCTTNHQTFDRPRHKAEDDCGPTGTTLIIGDGDGASARSQAVNALLFPVDEQHPRLVNLNCTVQQTDAIPHPLKVLLVCTDPLEQCSMTSEDSLYLAFTTASPTDGPDVNLSARQLTHSTAAVRWRGNLIGFRARDADGPHTEYLPATMDDLPAFVEFLGSYRPPLIHFAGPHAADHATPSQQPRHGRGAGSAGSAGAGRLPAGEIEDVLAYHLGTMMLPRFMPNVRFTLDRIPILDQMLGMCLPLPNATSGRGLRGSVHASNEEHENPVWSEVPRMAGEASVSHLGTFDVLEEQEDTGRLDESPRLTLQVSREELVGIVKDAIRKEGLNALVDTTLGISQQGLSAQREALGRRGGRSDEYGGAMSLRAMICIAIVLILLLVVAGGASSYYGFMHGWNGAIPDPIAKVFGLLGSVLDPIRVKA